MILIFFTVIRHMLQKCQERPCRSHLILLRPSPPHHNTETSNQKTSCSKEMEHPCSWTSAAWRRRSDGLKEEQTPWRCKTKPPSTAPCRLGPPSSSMWGAMRFWTRGQTSGPLGVSCTPCALATVHSSASLLVLAAAGGEEEVLVMWPGSGSWSAHF